MDARQTRDITKIGRGVYASAVFTPAASPYLANDCMDVAQAFDFGLVNGGHIIIRSTTFLIAHTALVASEAGYALHLYNVTPPSAIADNGAFDVPAGDRASYLGLLTLGTPVDLGSSLWIETHGLSKRVYVPASGKLYGYLVTAGGITPTAAARTPTVYADVV